MAIYRPKYSRKTDPGRRLAGRIFGAGAPFRQWIARLLPKRRTAGAGFSAAGRSRHIRGTHLLVAVAVVLAVLAGGTVFYHRLAASDVFRLTELEVSGNRIVERREIVEQSGLHQGVGLLGYDLEAARKRIEDLAWIDTARLRVVWPARVEITVREHRVLALVHQAGDRGGGLSYLDGKGRLFARGRPGQEIDYPGITGLPPEKQNDEQGGKSLRDDAIYLVRLAAVGIEILRIESIFEVHCVGD
jgi:cell division septal protein FtsQ